MNKNEYEVIDLEISGPLTAEIYARTIREKDFFCKKIKSIKTLSEKAEKKLEAQVFYHFLIHNLVFIFSRLKLLYDNSLIGKYSNQAINELLQFTFLTVRNPEERKLLAKKYEAELKKTFSFYFKQKNHSITDKLLIFINMAVNEKLKLNISEDQIIEITLRSLEENDPIDLHKYLDLFPWKRELEEYKDRLVVPVWKDLEGDLIQLADLYDIKLKIIHRGKQLLKKNVYFKARGYRDQIFFFKQMCSGLKKS